MRGDEALQPEAEKTSLEAVTAAPRVPSVLDTRGHVLLWCNRLAEAEPLLLRAYQLGKGSTRASAAAGMAVLCARLNRVDEAATWLERARAQDAPHRLVARAAALVEPLRRI
jgi:hypothetical protein